MLTAFAGLLPNRGKALDLACGTGRNSLWLSQRGLDATGIDLSSEALRQGSELANQAGCSITWVQEDLETYVLPPAEFDLILCFYYRNPALYPRIRAALRPGGLLVCETYTLDQLRYPTGPRNPDHLLRPRELLAAFADWHVLFYRETSTDRGLVSFIARKTR